MKRSIILIISIVMLCVTMTSCSEEQKIVPAMIILPAIPAEGVGRIMPVSENSETSENPEISENFETPETPETPEIPEAPEKPETSEITEETLNLIARAIYAEAQGEPFEGKVTVGATIVNRLEFTENLIYMLCQDYSNEIWNVSQEALNEVPECMEAAIEAIQGSDPAGEILGAPTIYFVDPDAEDLNENVRLMLQDDYYVEGDTITTIGNHVFFYKWLWEYTREEAE